MAADAPHQVGAPMTTGWFDRPSALDRLANRHFDVLVVGGGVTGSGCALDAASRGLRTALVEADDFASGTSSKSSKLVHGGLRYLQNGDFRLVYEALHERHRLTRNAPHLVHLLPFLLPVLTGRDSPVPRKLARAMGSAMWLYDLTGGARIGKLHKRLKAGAALAHMPTLPPERLRSAYLYYDAQTDDARLTLTLARTAALDFGATVANRARLVELVKDADGAITGARVDADGRTIEVSCSCVVNATGVWADDVRAIDEGEHPGTIRPAKGIHITVPWDLVRNDIAVVIPVPKDRRSVFVVPWHIGGSSPRYTYVGTTDTDYQGPLDRPECTPDDIAYLLDALNASVTTTVTEADICGTWAGLRPLVNSDGSGRTADLSRRHRIGTSAAGMVTVTGGKLTTYREMAAQTVDAAVQYLGTGLEGRTVGRSRTKRLLLRGAQGYEDVRRSATPAGLAPGAVAELADRYGGEARVLLAMVEHDPDLGSPLVQGLPYLAAEAVYAARYEMAGSVVDVLARRTRAHLLDARACATAAHHVAALMAPELGWDDAEAQRQAEAYRALVATEQAAPHLAVGP